MFNIKLIRPNNLLFMGLLLLIVKSIIPFSAIIPYCPIVDNILQYSATILLSISILKKKYSIKTLIVYLVITLISFYCCLQVKEWGMLITVIIVLAIRDEDFNKIIHFVFQYELIIFILHLIISIMCFPITNYLTSIIKDETVLVFGFAHKNSFAIILFNLIIMWCWINYTRLRKKTILSILFFGALLFYLSNSRTAMMVLLVFVILIILFAKKQSSVVLQYVSMLIFPTFSILWFICIKYYMAGFSFLSQINKVLSDRIVMAVYYYNKVGFTLFGQNVNDIIAVWDQEYKLSGSLTFDSTYSYLLISRGIIFVIMCSVFLLFLSRKRNNKINIFIIIWSLYAITEAVGLNCFLSFPIMLITLLIGKREVYENAVELQ